jgi:hypothetical protein
MYLLLCTVYHMEADEVRRESIKSKQIVSSCDVRVMFRTVQYGDSTGSLCGRASAAIVRIFPSSTHNVNQEEKLRILQLALPPLCG